LRAQERAVLIEHPARPGLQLMSKDRPAETARDVYRFELKVPAGQTATQAVTEERDVGSTVLLTNSPDEQVRLFLQSPVVSAKVKEGLKRAQELRWEWARTQREVGEQQRQLQAVTEDQARLRANLREVPQSSPLHQRYLDKLNQQEDEVEKYRAEVKRLQGQEHARRKALDDFLASFSAE
jgi:septal ring factor EnvC (AmiA/AmiB activator)